MIRFAPLAVILFALILVATLWLSAPSGVASENTTPDSHIAAPSPMEVEPITAHPRAVVEETTFDFGILPRFTRGEHSFIIHNEGEAPLTLKQGPTTCSCTILGLEQSEIAPGQQAEVKLEWDLKFKEGEFQQSAIVRTNDPNTPEIELIVKGLIETRLSLSQSSLAFTTLANAPPGSQDTLLYSRTWKEMEDVQWEITTDIPGLNVELQDATAAEMAELEARSAKKIHIQLDEALEPGQHVGQIELTARPADATAAEPMSVTLTVEVQAKKPGFKFFSPEIDGYGRIRLGGIDADKGSELLKINFRVDQGSTPWNIKQVDTYPNSLTAKVIPVDASVGLYQLQIQVPPGSPKGNYYGAEVGRIVLLSDHPWVPRIPAERLGILVEFNIE